MFVCEISNCKYFTDPLRTQQTIAVCVLSQQTGADWFGWGVNDRL